MTTETTTDTSTEDVSGLKNKNSELLRKLKEAEKRAEAAEAENEELADKAAASDELSKLQRAFNKLERERDSLLAERDTLSADLKTIRVDNAVKDAMTANKVRPELQPAVEALLLRQVDDDDMGTIDGKPIAEAAKAFFASKEGSYFVSAPDSTGSGSSGPTKVSATRFDKAPETPQELNDFMAFSATNKEEANTYAMKWDRDDLMS